LRRSGVHVALLGRIASSNYKLHAALFSSDRLVVSLSWEDVYAEKARTAGRRRLACFTGHCPVCRTFSRRAKTIRVLGSDPARNIFSPEAFTLSREPHLTCGSVKEDHRGHLSGVEQQRNRTEAPPLTTHGEVTHQHNLQEAHINEPVKADGVCYASSARSFCLNPRRSFFRGNHLGYS